MKKTYPSKRSPGLIIVISILFFAPLIPMVTAEEFNLNFGIILIVIFLLFAFILHMLLKTVYTIDGDQLKIKCGFIPYKPIQISEIKEISVSKSIISSPSASFDRIEIKYGKFDELIISPEDKFSFAEDLVSLNQSIKNNLTQS